MQTIDEVDGEYACEINEEIELGGNVFHEVDKYSCAVGGIEVLNLDEGEFGKSREVHAFCHSASRRANRRAFTSVQS